MYVRDWLITLGNWEQMNFILPFYSSSEVKINLKLKENIIPVECLHFSEIFLWIKCMRVFCLFFWLIGILRKTVGSWEALHVSVIQIDDVFYFATLIQSHWLSKMLWVHYNNGEYFIGHRKTAFPAIGIFLYFKE